MVSRSETRGGRSNPVLPREWPGAGTLTGMKEGRKTARGRRRRRVQLLTVAAVALASVAASCGSNDPELTFPGPTNHLEVGVARVQQGDRYSVGMEGTICLDQPGTVQLTGVRLVRPHGLRVTGFGLRPNPNWKPVRIAGTGNFLGEDPTPLRQLGYTGKVIDAACVPHKPVGYELGVRLLKTAHGEASAAAWTVIYRSGGAMKAFNIPFSLKLCRDVSADDRPCRRFPL